MSSRNAVFTDGWQRACQLYDLLGNGGTVPVAPPTTVRLAPGEQTLLESHLGYERYFGDSVRAPVQAQRKHGIGMYGILPTAILRANYNRKVRARNKEWARWAQERASRLAQSRPT